MEPQIIDLGFVNAYLLRAGDGFVLIDTGMPFHWGRLEAELIRAGALPNRLKLTVITHADIDHTGGCAKLQKKYKVPIAVHAGDRDQAETGKILDRETTAPLMRKLMRLLQMVQRRGVPPVYETFHPDVTLAEGQSLAPYGLNATVWHIPGHTPGSIAVLAGDSLFAGDTVVNRGGSHMSPYIFNRDDLRRSIERLKVLSGVTVYPGHGKPFPVSEIREMQI
jgi:hydroxyacylglutathione hydrolase